MVLKTYAVFDDAVKAYNQPFYCSNERDAIYSFEQLVNDERTTVHRSPGDFTLFQIGEYDDQTGLAIPLKVFKNLGVASKYLKRPELASV